MKYYFDHEKLIVYQKSLTFVEFADSVLKIVDSKIKVHDQFDRTSTSIVLNIAEGNGKYSSKDRRRYFDISRGSALESAACLDVMVSKKILKVEDLSKGKELLYEIVSMLIVLIKSNSDRTFEPEESYGDSKNQNEKSCS